jgi:cytochrome b
MECHETGFLLLIAFVAVHVLAVAVHQLHENKPLARSMISGRKSFSSQELQEAAGLPGVPPQATPGENQ